MHRKRIACISSTAPGHIDFGGFVETAQELMRRGHEVEWFVVHSSGTTAGRAGASAPAQKARLDRRGLPTSIVDLATEEAAFIERLACCGCAIVDRICLEALHAIALARIPWAAIGTDGKQYRSEGLGVAPGPMNDESVTRFVNLGFPQPITSFALEHGSFWAASPFLNVSFLPRSFHAARLPDHDSTLPEHAHFVGSAEPGRSPTPASPTTTRTVLVTLGSTMTVAKVGTDYRARMEALPEAVQHALRSYPDEQLTVLTGSEDVSARLAEKLPAAIIKTFVPYADAFATAAVAVGHGGTAFVVAATRAGVPMVAMPTGGDQSMNARAIERLGAGCAVAPSAPDLPRQIGEAVRRVLDQPRFAEAAQQLKLSVASGGSFMAAASLVARLAEGGSPVTRCVDDRCCC